MTQWRQWIGGILGAWACAGLGWANGMMVVDRVPANFKMPPHWIRPMPMPMPAPVPGMVVLPVKAQHAQVKIVDQVATVEIDEIFANESYQQLEATYIFPIPDSASITDFKLEIDGKLTEGKVLDRDEATGIYQGYLSRSQDPALLEYVGRKAFRARVFPILPRSERRIQLKYSQTLKQDGKLRRFVYPLDTGRLNPTPIKDVAIEVEVESRKVPIKTVYSPTHGDDIEVARRGDKKAIVTLEAKDVMPDRDFVLYTALSAEDVGLSLFPFREDEEAGGFVLMVMTPPVEASASLKEQPKDVVCVLDISGSMREGERMLQARKALAYCVGQLGAEDRFNLVTFNQEAVAWKSSLVKATPESKGEAEAFIKDLVPTGGTNVEEALTTGLSFFEDSARGRIIVFLSDGIPTVGQTDMGKLIKLAKETNRAKARLFAFGVGHDVNTHLLDMLSEQHHGVSEYVEPHENIEVKVSSLYAKVSSPVMTDLSLEVEGTKMKELYPRPLPDLYRGTQLIALGRYDKPGKVKVHLKGKVAGKDVVYDYEDDLPKWQEEHEFVPKLWAMRKVGHLLNQIRLHGEQEEIVEEIKEIGQDYGVVTPYTSYLVEEPGARNVAFRNMGFGKEKADRLALRAPGLVAGAMNLELRENKTGEDAVKIAKKVQDYARAESESGWQAAQSGLAGRGNRLKGGKEVEEQDGHWAGAQVVQNVGRQAFYQKNERWEQAGYKDQKTQKLTYLSDEYFALLKKEPGIKRHLSRLGAQAVFNYRGQWYEVAPKKG